MGNQAANFSAPKGFFYFRHPQKSAVVALILSVFLGGFGMHRVYLGKRMSGVVMFILSLITIVLTFSGLSGLETMEFSRVIVVASAAVGFGMVVFTWVFVDLLIISIGVLSASSRVKEPE